MKEKNMAGSVALKVLKIARWVSTVTGSVFIVALLVIIYTGIEQSNRDAIWVEEINHKLLAGEPEQYPEDVDYELEARVVDGNEESAWYRNAIVADFGNQIEVRLKAFSAHPENVREDIVFRNGFSISQTSGLGLANPLLNQKIALPNAGLTDYPENINNSNTQYYYIGVYQLNWKDWTKGRPASMLTAYNYDSPSVSLLILPPYNAVNIRVIAILAGVIILCFLILPIIFDVAGYLIIKRLNSMH